MQKLDGEWLAMADVHVNWVAKSGRFAINRSKYNDRGDAASTAARQKPIEEIGVQYEQREAPRFIQHQDPKIHDEFRAPTWATLSAGMKRALKADPDGVNRAVQLSLQKGLPRTALQTRSTLRRHRLKSGGRRPRQRTPLLAKRT